MIVIAVLCMCGGKARENGDADGNAVVSVVAEVVVTAVRWVGVLAGLVVMKRTCQRSTIVTDTTHLGLEKWNIMGSGSRIEGIPERVWTSVPRN
jgi:uncharacterized membrane protein